MNGEAQNSIRVQVTARVGGLLRLIFAMELCSTVDTSIDKKVTTLDRILKMIEQKYER
jgi:hypothetical protein